MKKKIKDLTLKEARKICDENIGCSGCPLAFGQWCYGIKLDIIEQEKDFDLEQEVEVDEEN